MTKSQERIVLVFKKGHRIRLDVSSSNFRRFDVNPNLGEPLNDNRRVQVANNTIYLDAQHPSQIIPPPDPDGCNSTGALRLVRTNNPSAICIPSFVSAVQCARERIA